MGLYDLRLSHLFAAGEIEPRVVRARGTFNPPACSKRVSLGSRLNKKII